MKNGTPMIALSSYSIRVIDDCVNCGLCVESCPFDAPEFADKKLVINDKCIGCGVCVNNCEKNAMYLERDTAKRELLEIKPLLKEVSN